MTTTAKALKDHFSDGANLLILLAGMAGVSRLIASVPIEEHASIGDAAFLIADLAGVAYSIVEESL